MSFALTHVIVLYIFQHSEQVNKQEDGSLHPSENENENEEEEQDTFPDPEEAEIPRFPNLKVSTSGKNGNGSRLTFNKGSMGGTSGGGGGSKEESSKSKRSSKKDNTSTTTTTDTSTGNKPATAKTAMTATTATKGGSSAGGAGAATPTSFFRSAGTAQKGGERKVSTCVLKLCLCQLVVASSSHDLYY